MVKVGLDARPLSTPLSGVGRLISEILKAYPDKKNVRFYCFSHKPLHSDHQNLAKEPHLEFPKNGGFYKIKGGIYYNVFVPYLVRKWNLDVFWGSQQVLPPFLPRALPAFLTFHDLLLYRFPNTMRGIARLQQKIFQSYSVNRSRFILCNSKTTQNEMCHHFQYPKEMTSITYPAVQNNWIVESRKKPRKPPYLLAVSTIEPRKNYSFLLSVYKLWKERHPEFEFLIVGKKGWEKQSMFEELVSEKGISLISGANDYELQKIYEEASLFLFASLYEGFGIPLIEAMCKKIPCVVSDIGTFQEIAQGMFPCLPSSIGRDESKWMEAMEKVLSSKKTNYNLKRFSWEQAAKTTHETIQRLSI